MVFTVIAPNGLTSTLGHDNTPGTPGPPNNRVGCSSVFNCTVLPTTVSFYNARLRENIPGESWTWPDGTAGSHPHQIVEWNTGYANNTSDTSARYPDPIHVLWNGTAYVSYSASIRVPEDYWNGSSWVSWLPGENHPKYYRGSDQATRTAIIANNTAYGGWMGPWR